jgi:ankyrin repeat protein
MKGQLEVVQALIENGCFTFVVDEDGNGLLHLASGFPLLLNWLLAHCDLDQELKNSQGQSYQDLLPNLMSHEEVEVEKEDVAPEQIPIDVTPSPNHQTSASPMATPSHSPKSTDEPTKPHPLITHQTTEAFLTACFSEDFAVAMRLLPMSDVNCHHQSSLTPLQFSCHVGNLQFTEALLRAGADPNLQDRKGMTALHYSCQNRNVYLIELLIRFRATFLSDNRGFTPLHLVAITGDEDIFKLLMSHNANINEIDHSGNSAFFYLIEGRYLELATWCLENENHSAPNIYLANINDLTPLDVARNHGYVEFCTKAIATHQKYEHEFRRQTNTKRFIDLLSSSKWNEAEDILKQTTIDPNLNVNGISPLHLCCQLNQIKLLESLLLLGAEINLQDKNSMTPLMIASKMGEMSLVTTLLSHHCDVTLKDQNDWTALFYAISGDHVSIAKILYGISPHFETDLTGNTILHIACLHHSLRCIRWLVSSLGLLLSDGTMNNAGDTVLSLAKKQNEEEILNISTHQLESLRAENTAAFVKALQTDDLSLAMSLAKSFSGINPNDIDPITGQVVFHLVCQHGTVELVKILLDQGASVTLESPQGRNALHCACHAGKLEIIRWLKKIGSSLDKFSSEGLAPFHYACRSGNLSTVRWLIDRGVVPSLCSTDSSTSLHYACSSGNKELVNYLLSEHQFQTSVNTRNSSGLLPIDFAAREGAVELVLWLSRSMTLPENTLRHLKSQATTKRKQQMLCEHELQLFDGAQTGDLNKIQIALEFGINIDTNTCSSSSSSCGYSSQGMTALHLACSENKIKVIQYLLERSAHVECVTKDGLTPLHIAAMKGYTEIFNYLIDHEANVKALDKDGNDVLIHASGSHTPELAKAIVMRYPWFNECRRNRLGVSALVTAANSENYDLVLWLTRNSYLNRQHHLFFEALTGGAVDVIDTFLTNGIDLNITDEEGQSPLHILCDLGLHGLVQKSIQLGANENAVDRIFQTPLHRAAQRGYTEIVKYLCDIRVKIDQLDDFGMSPLLYACKEGHLLTIAYLVGQGASLSISNLEDCNTLHLVCQGDTDDLSLVQWLCEGGFQLSEDQMNIFSKTPQDVALDSGHTQIFTFLEQRQVIRNIEKQRIEKELNDAMIEKERQERELQAKIERERVLTECREKERLQRLAEEREVEMRTQEMIKVAASRQLLELSKQGCVDDVKELLCHHVDIVASSSSGSAAASSCCSEERWTPLHYASRNGSFEMIQALLHAGANVNALTLCNETPLLLAMRYHGSNSKLFWLLYHHGARPDIETTSGEKFTSLHYICEAGNIQLWNQIFVEKIPISQVLLEDLVRYSAKLNQSQILTQLLATGVNPDAVDSDSFGKTALHLACENGSSECILTLLHAGAAIELADESGKTPLIYSVLSERYEAVSTLISNHASVFNVDHDGNTPLHHACQAGNSKIGILLVQNGSDIYLTNVATETPYQLALGAATGGATGGDKTLANYIRKEMEKTVEILDICSSGDHEGLLVLIKKHFDINRRDKDRVSGFHLAAQHGHLEICQTLLKSGLHVDTCDRFGKTPMSYACCNGLFEIVQFLCDNGADIHHLAVDSRSYLHFAAQANSSPDATALLQWLIVHKQLDCNALADENYTPLHDAAMSDNLFAIEMLIQNGAIISCSTASGVTPFSIACQRNNLTAAKLLAASSDIDAADVTGVTSFLQACMDTRFEMIIWLYSLGANCWISRHNGDTALHLAARSKNQDLIEWLVLKGFDPYAVNKLGQNSIDLALEGGGRELAEWMKTESADPLVRCNALVRELEVSLQKSNLSLMNSLFQEVYTLYSHKIIGTHSLSLLLCGAASLDLMDEMDLLLRVGVKVNVKSPLNGMTPLHYACKQGHLRVVNHLIEKGADMSMKDSKNRTPFDLSILFHQDQIANAFRLLEIESSAAADLRHKDTYSDSDSQRNDSDSVPIPVNGSSESVFVKSINPLHAACQRDDHETVKQLLENSNELVNSRVGSNQRTPLLFCLTENPNEELINLLLTYGADPNLLDANGMSSLHYSCELRRSSMITMSLIKFKASLTLVNGRGDTSLHIICKNDMVELMTAILDLPRSILKNLKLNVEDRTGKNLLHVAAHVGSLAMATQLLRQGVLVNHPDQHLTTPLHIAVTQTQFDIAQLFLEHGADPNALDQQNQSPISLSILKLKDLNYSRLLHKFGAKLETSFLDNGESFLHVACRNGNVELAKWLVRNGLNPSAENNQGKSPVELAHSCGKEDLLEWLLAWIVAVRVDRPVEMILAEASGSTPHREEDDEDDEDEEKDEDETTQKESISEVKIGSLHGVPVPSLSTRSKSSTLDTSFSGRSNRQIALL